MFFNAQRIKKMHKWNNISNGETRARFFKKKKKNIIGKNSYSDLKEIENRKEKEKRIFSHSS